MEVKRDIFLNRLVSRKNNGMVKVITGLRRCGPNNVGVPDTPETSPCYGLKEIVFGVPKPIR